MLNTGSFSYSGDMFADLTSEIRNEIGSLLASEATGSILNQAGGLFQSTLEGAFGNWGQLLSDLQGTIDMGDTVNYRFSYTPSIGDSFTWLTAGLGIQGFDTLSHNFFGGGSLDLERGSSLRPVPPVATRRVR